MPDHPPIEEPEPLAAKLSDEERAACYRKLFTAADRLGTLCQDIASGAGAIAARLEHPDKRIDGGPAPALPRFEATQLLADAGAIVGYLVELERRGSEGSGDE